MKKAIFPIIGAILLPVIFWQVNPKIEPVGIILAAGIGLGLGLGISKALFREKKAETKTETEANSK